MARNLQWKRYLRTAKKVVDLNRNAAADEAEERVARALAAAWDRGYWKAKENLRTYLPVYGMQSD